MGNTIRLEPLQVYIDPSAKPVDRRLDALKAYWRGKADAAGTLPSRAQINPREMLPHLPSILLLNVTGQGRFPKDFSVRLCGTALDDLFGQDITGMRLDELVASQWVKLAAGALAVAGLHRCPIRFYGRIDVAGEVDACLEAMVMPLSPDGQHVDMLLCEVVTIRQMDLHAFPELTADLQQALGA